MIPIFPGRRGAPPSRVTRGERRGRTTVPRRPDPIRDTAMRLLKGIKLKGSIVTLATSLFGVNQCGNRANGATGVTGIVNISRSHEIWQVRDVISVRETFPGGKIRAMQSTENITRNRTGGGECENDGESSD